MAFRHFWPRLANGNAAIFDVFFSHLSAPFFHGTWSRRPKKNDTQQKINGRKPGKHRHNQNTNGVPARTFQSFAGKARRMNWSWSAQGDVANADKKKVNEQPTRKKGTAESGALDGSIAKAPFLLSTEPIPRN